MRASGPYLGPTRVVPGAAAAVRAALLSGAFLALPGIAAPAEAPRPSVHLDDGGGSLFAGQRVIVTWDGLPADVREVELLLSLDGGRRFPIRLTESFDPAPGTFAWLVPCLPATGARLRLRYGRAGREEEDAEPSAPFGIFVPPSSPAARLERREGEWWVAEEENLAPPGLQSGGAARPAALEDCNAVAAEDDNLVDTGPKPSVGVGLVHTAETFSRISPRPARTREPEAPKRE